MSPRKVPRHGPTPPFRRAAGRRAAFQGALLAVAAAAFPPPARGQVDRVAAGLAGGAVGFVSGAYVTTAIYVARARTGSYLYSLDDFVRVRWETVPIGLLPAAGAFLGASSPVSLGRALLWGGMGFAGGALLGLGTARLLGADEQGLWAGAIVGSAAGLLAGAVLGAATVGDGPGPPEGGGSLEARAAPPVHLAMSVPLSWP